MSFSPVLGLKAFYLLFNVLNLFLYSFEQYFFISYVKGYIQFLLHLRLPELCLFNAHEYLFHIELSIVYNFANKVYCLIYLQ